MKNKIISNAKFIVLEGIDGSGTTSNAKYLVETLNELGIKSIYTNEPNLNNPIGALIKQDLLKRDDIDPESMLLMFAADRRQHINSRIWPALENNTWVVCDRYIMSTLSYQIQFCNAEMVYYLCQGLLIPDLTLYLDIPSDQGLKRVETRNSNSQKEIYEKNDLLSKVRDEYLQLANLETPNFFSKKTVIIDSSKSKDNVEQEILEEIHNLIKGEN